MEVITDPDDYVIRTAEGRFGDGDGDGDGDVDGHEVGHALTIGVFDGVHLGHRQVIEQVRRRAGELSAKSALVTFNPHPAMVLRPDLAPPLLTGLDHKLELLEETGLDTVVVVPFDKARASESAEDFVNSILVGCLGAKAVVVGENFKFGKGRLGNVKLLTEMGEDCGFDVHSQPLISRPAESMRLSGHGSVSFADLGDTVSSTAIRRALTVGEVGLAARLLARPHEVRGQVADGDRRGRTIGFPTANVIVESGFAMPGDGVYAGWYLLPDGSRWPSAVNVGRRPTFYETAEHPLVEAHLIGFEGDLYGQPARVQFVDRLRGEQRFDGLDELKAQLQQDVDTAVRRLTGG